MEQSDDDESITIDPKGDVYLRVAHTNGLSQSVRYRVSASKLKDASMYFRTLFDPTKFDEGIRLAAQRQSSIAPSEQPGDARRLPVVSIIDAGLPLSDSAKDFFQNFLLCAHSLTTLYGFEKWTFASIYSLARVADRFLARDVLRPTIQSIRHMVKYSPRGHRKTKAEISERLCRQKLIIGLWYGFEEWVSYFSWRLVVQGSSQWDEAADDDMESQKVTEDLELWHLPEGLEEELYYRRTCILETLGSVQDMLVGKYLAKERVCKSGLDSSLQCDLFQLGQALRFLNRKELVSLQNLMNGQDFKPSSPESLLKLCTALMECPSYQIDAFHQNCGLRTRLVRCVEIVQQHISTDAHVGVCLVCWRGRRSEHSWSEDAAPVGISASDERKANDHQLRHAAHGRQVADLFTENSFVARCESGWRPRNWRYQWMHDGVTSDEGGANAPDLR